MNGFCTSQIFIGSPSNRLNSKSDKAQVKIKVGTLRSRDLPRQYKKVVVPIDHHEVSRSRLVRPKSSSGPWYPHKTEAWDREDKPPTDGPGDNHFLHTVHGSKLISGN